MKKTNRREFVNTALKATLAGTVGTSMIITEACGAKPALQTAASYQELATTAALQFAQVKLPYDYAALEPWIDAMTMDIHYNRHHAAYVKNANDAITDEKIGFATEKEFFANTSKLSAKARNNGGGVYNHNFFWQVMKPNSGGAPGGKLADALNGTFGSFDKFKEQFSAAALGRFGSGWAWLVNDNGKLKIGSTPNQDNPLMNIADIKGTPLLALDVWEHAYYLKYQNKRNEYVANWWNVVNWEEASRLFQ
ncbi:MAG: superoxide dismutase [Cyclobacteriaceae bacterium]|jgi:Fe-Mn family superoxide dismutase|nr:superoxide dismutase [Cyclobacteriaceae bacterium]